jgi:hypothetical protein
MTTAESSECQPSSIAWWQSSDGNWHPPEDGRSYGLTGYADTSGESVPDRMYRVLGFATIVLGVLTISGLMDSKTKSAAFALVGSGFFLCLVLTGRRGRRLKRGEGQASPQ